MRKRGRGVLPEAQLSKKEAPAEAIFVLGYRKRDLRRRCDMKALFTALTFSSVIAAVLCVQFAHAAPPVDATREQAIHECAVRAQRYPETTWGNMDIQTYRACMATKGQQE